MSGLTQLGGKRIIVLGGGLSGLSYTHYLRNFASALDKNKHISKIIVLEANDYMGGSVKSSVFEDGMIHELGPRSVRTQGVRAQNTVTLLEQLGLEDRVVSILSDSPAGRVRYIYNNNQLYPLEMSALKLFSKLPYAKTTLAGALYKDFTTKKMDLSDVPYRDPSIYQFFSHRFGEEVAEKVVDPLMRGITAGDARKLSTKALFGDLLEREQTYGSIIKGMNKPPVVKMAHDELFPHDILDSKLLDKFQKDKVLSYNLKSGLQTLPEHLSNSLLNTNDDNAISIYNQTKVVSIKFQEPDFDKPPCCVKVRTVDGDLVELAADHIVSTIPSKNLAEILPESMLEEQKKALDNVIKIPHSPVGCVCVEFRGLDKKKLSKVINSFGFLTHSKSDSKLLGVSFDSAMFPEIDAPHDSSRMTCMIGGSWYREIFGTDNLDQVTDAKLEQVALEEIRRILKIEDDPFRTTSLLWKTGIAQYELGHKERLEETRAELAKLSIPLTLLGQSYDGVAINDVVFSARMAAYKFIKAL